MKSESEGTGQKSEITRQKTAEQKSKLKIIVFLVSADPKPIIMTITFTSDGSVAPTDIDSVNGAFLRKLNDGWRGFALKRAKLLSVSF